MKRKRMISILLALALVLSLLPITAGATGTGKAIQLVDKSGAAPTADNIAGAQASSVYFGSYKQSSDGNGGYKVEPVLWRVLKNADGKLLLLSDKNLGYMQFCYNHIVDKLGLSWEYSNILYWLNDINLTVFPDFPTTSTDVVFKDAAFSEKEYAAAAEAEAACGGKLFILSQDEAREYGLEHPDNEQIEFITTEDTDYVQAAGNDGSWWTRTLYDDENVHGVSGIGTPATKKYEDPAGVRPAFYLDLSSVLFTSAANGGKPTDTGLSAVPTTDTADWKLTLSDSSRSGFTASFDSASGDKWTIKYSGATTGENEYISAMVVSSAGEVTYYGRLAAAKADPATGTNSVTVDMSGKLADGDTVYVFNEQCNGDYKTDYASELKFIKKAALITLTADDVVVGEDAVISFTMNKAATGTMDVTVNGTTYSAQITDGEGIVVVTGLSADSYTVEADYSGNEYYAPSTASTKFTVSAASGGTGGTEPVTLPGSGTKDDPYQISTAAQLGKFRDIVNGANGETQNSEACAVLKANIDLGGLDAEGNLVEANKWTPICPDDNTYYTGTFDGAGFEISGLNVSGELRYAGLFGYIGSKGVVENLSVSGKVEAEATYVGGVAGWNSGTVQNCHYTGTVTATVEDGNAHTGGIAGGNTGTVQNCYNTGDVTVTAEKNNAYAGGVAGVNDGTVQNCYNTGKVTATAENGIAYAGGVAGENTNTVQNCYNTGEVTATETGEYSTANAGGVAGRNTGTVQNCYNTGGVTATTVNKNNAFAGGAAGRNYGTVTQCYYLTGTAEKGIGYGTGEAAPLTAGEFKLESSFYAAGSTDKTWDFENVWYMGNTPLLRVFAVEIGTADELAAFAQRVNDGEYGLNAILTGNIDLNKAWTPMGPGSNSAYTGTFNGAGFEISGLNVSGNYEYAGLFGVIGSNGCVTDLSVSGSVSAMGDYAYAGGVVGENYGTVKNCYNTGSVSATATGEYSNAFSGGVAGYNTGTVQNCHYTGTVTATATATNGSADAGGVAGYNTGTVQNCYNTGAVTATATNGSAYAGGVAGYNTGRVQNCYNTGDVTATATGEASTAFAGGVAGWNEGTVQNCYNTGTVEAKATFAFAGGVAGYNYGTVKECYYLTGKADRGIGEGTGSASALKADEFKLESSFYVSGSTDKTWDFENVWDMGKNAPYLKALGEPPTVTATGEIKVKAVLEGREWQDADEFTFTLEDADGKLLDTVSVTGTTPEHTASFKTVDLTEAGSYTFKVKETKGLISGIVYDEKEYKVTITVKNDGQGNLVAAEGSTLTHAETFTNRYVTGALTVSNTVFSAVEADADRAFDFTVTLSDTTVSGAYGDMTFENGVAKLSLKNGESAAASGLFAGIRYIVTQTAYENFETSKTGDTGAISETAAAAAFVNTSTVSVTDTEEYPDGSRIVTVSQGNTVTATYYDKDGNVVEKDIMVQNVDDTVNMTIEYYENGVMTDSNEALLDLSDKSGVVKFYEYPDGVKQHVRTGEITTDESGSHVTMKDPDGNIIGYSDAVFGDGETTTTESDENHNVISTTLSVDETDETGKVLKTTDTITEGNTVRVVEYYPSGSVIKETETVTEGNKVTVTEKDADGKVVKTTETVTNEDNTKTETVTEGNTVTVTEKDAEGNITKTTETVTENNTVTVTEKDAQGDTTRTTETVTNPDGGTVETVTEGNTVTVTEKDGQDNVTKTTETVTNPDGSTVETVTEGNTVTVTEKDAQGNTTKTTETVTNADGSTVETVTEGDTVTVTEKDAQGDTTKTTETVTNPDGSTVETVTEGSTVTVTEKDAQGDTTKTTETVMNADGSTVETVTEGNTVTVTEKDAQGDVTKTTETVTNADGSTVETVTEGNTVTVTEKNAQGDTTKTTVTEKDGAKVTVTEYDASGDVVSETVTKSTPVISTVPTASAITYGQSLGDSVLLGGQADQAGAFSWADGTIQPSVSDSGRTAYTVIFTPTDTDHYDTAACTVTLTVHKAPLIIKAKDLRMFSGDPLPAWTSDSYTVEGLLGEDALETEPAVVYQQNGEAAEVDTDSAGEYEIWPENAEAGNYEIAYESGTLMIEYLPDDEPSAVDTTPTPVEPQNNTQQEEHGTIEIKSQPDGTVLVIPKADKGYVADWITVTDQDGNRVKVTKNEDGTFSFKEPEGGYTVKAEFLEEIENPFIDVEADKYYYDPVVWALQKGITKGTDESHFSPKEPCTRGQVLTFLWRAAGCPMPTLTENPFDDVSEESYYYLAVLWAFEQGITLGNGDGGFDPDKVVTRGDSVTFLFRALGAQMEGSIPFGDVGSGDYCYNAVLWAYLEGVTNGTAEDTFSPDAPCQRDHIITFLYRAYHR